MMKSEFIERTGFEPTPEEYRVIEDEYMASAKNKDEFCKEWKKNGGVQRLTRLRARRIEELEAQVEAANRKTEKVRTDLEKEIDNYNERIRELMAERESLKEEYVESIAKVLQLEKTITKFKNAYLDIRNGFKTLEMLTGGNSNEV